MTQGRLDVEHWDRGSGRQNKAVPLLAANRRVVAGEAPTGLCSRLISQIKLHLSTTQEEQGGFLFTAVGKEMAILSARAQKGIVSHCFPLNAGRVRGGSAVGEERRAQGQK